MANERLAERPEAPEWRVDRLDLRLRRSCSPPSPESEESSDNDDDDDEEEDDDDGAADERPPEDDDNEWAEPEPEADADELGDVGRLWRRAFLVLLRLCCCFCLLARLGSSSARTILSIVKVAMRMSIWTQIGISKVIEYLWICSLLFSLSLPDTRSGRLGSSDWPLAPELLLAAWISSTSR